MPKPTDNFVELTSMFSVSTGAISADLQQIPNQPISFRKDPSLKPRTEEALVAWTWKEFLDNTSDPNILIRLPMTKASVRGNINISSSSLVFTSKLINVAFQPWMLYKIFPVA